LAILIWGLVEARKEAAAEAEHERPVESPRVSATSGELVIKVSRAEQARNGFEASTLAPTTRQPELRANAVVLPVQELTDLRANYVTAHAQLAKAQASFEVSRQEYERLNTLYQNDRNASLKSVQAALGTMRSDEVAVNAAQDSVALAESNVRQRWGPVISDWLLSNSAAFQKLIRQESFLVQVTLPAGTEIAAPPTVRLQVTAEKTQLASFVSPLPQVDLRIQAPSHLYITSKHAALVPGLNVVALLSSGVPLRGVIIPSRAVVWWQGKAWAYVQTGPEEFVRGAVPTEDPVTGAWFVTQNFSSGEKVVVKGAQQLLSEEFRSQIKVVGEQGERK
jgi:hypothetical protein